MVANGTCDVRLDAAQKGNRLVGGMKTFVRRDVQWTGALAGKAGVRWYQM